MSLKDVQRLFDGQASRWAENYRPKGDMVDRPAAFSDALAAHLPAGAAVLDYGCGAGDVAIHLREQGWQVAGIDLSPAMIDVARGRADSIGWHVMPARGRLPFDDSTFDACIASSVLEYVDAPEAVIAEIARVLRPGAQFLATVPDMRDDTRRRERMRAFVARLPGMTRAFQGTRWEFGMGYLRLSKNRFPPEQWLAVLGAAGFDTLPVPPCCGPLVMLGGRLV